MSQPFPVTGAKLESPFLVSCIAPSFRNADSSSAGKFSLAGTRGESGKAWTMTCTTCLSALADSKAQRLFDVWSEKVLSWGETQRKWSGTSPSLVLAVVKRGDQEWEKTEQGRTSLGRGI